MRALISPNEKVYSYTGAEIGIRVAEVSQQGFEVALPLFWAECADDVVADRFYYNTATQTINAVPVRPAPFEPEPIVPGGPSVIVE
jgi:hypothetical protein